MFKWSIVILVVFLIGCTSGFHYPALLGPAEEVHCTLDRTGGSMIGEYKCEIEGKYQMNEFGL